MNERVRKWAIWAIFAAVELIGVLWLLLSLQLETGWPGWVWCSIYGLQFVLSAVIALEKAGVLSWK